MKVLMIIFAIMGCLNGLVIIKSVMASDWTLASLNAALCGLFSALFLCEAIDRAKGKQ